MANKALRTVSRTQFSIDFKQEIWEKSDGRCCKCGCSFNEKGKMFTIEHVIPLSKGGTNDKDNVIGLCKQCNLEKGEMVVTKSLGKYYKYLNTEQLALLETYVENYVNNSSLLNFNTWLSSDIEEITLGKIRKGSKKHLDRDSVILLNVVRLLKKAVYTDLQDIVDFAVGSECFIDTTKDEMVNSFKNAFIKGSIYVLRSCSGSILGCFCVSLELEYSSLQDKYVILPKIYNVALRVGSELHLAMGICRLFDDFLVTSNLECCSFVVDIDLTRNTFALADLFSSIFIRKPSKPLSNPNYLSFYTIAVIDGDMNSIVNKSSIETEDKKEFLITLENEEDAFFRRIWNFRSFCLVRDLTIDVLNTLGNNIVYGVQ